MKQKLTRSVLALSLALAIVLALTPLTALAGPGSDGASATELKAGESDTFTASGTDGGWYKFELNEASQVTITLRLQSGTMNDWAIITVNHGRAGGNDMWKYVGPTGGSPADREYGGRHQVSVNDNLLSTTGTYFLAEGWCYIGLGYRISTEHPAPITVKIDSIEPIADTGGLTREDATAVDPVGGAISQYAINQDRNVESYFYKFTLPEAASVSIQLSTRLEPGSAEHDDRLNAGVTMYLKYATGVDIIHGLVDGEDGWRLHIRELDASLTQVITYELPAGTYYVELYVDYAYRGTEFTLSFTSSLSAATPGAPNIGSADGWARDAIEDAYALGLIPDSLQSNYTTLITRAEYCAIAVRLYELYTGDTITTFSDFSDTGDINVRKLAGVGVVQGNGDGTFGPNGVFTREQMAAISVNLVETMTGVGIPASNPNYTDMDQAQTWFRPYIGQVQAAGIMQGVGDNRFDPKSELDRQSAIMLTLNLYNFL